MKMHRTVVTALYVVFARPDEFDWRAAQTFRDDRCLALNVRISHSASAKAATGHLSMKSDLLRLESQHFGDGHLIDRLKLRAGPHFGTIAVETHSRIQGLHRRMSEKRKFIFGS